MLVTLELRSTYDLNNARDLKTKEIENTLEWPSHSVEIKTSSAAYIGGG